MKSKQTVAIIVARMGSSRVPGKSLIDLCGKSVLGHMLEIAQQIPGVQKCILATTAQVADDPLMKVAQGCGVPVFRGDAERVLDRVYGAALEMGAETVVEVGGDCPLLDPVAVGAALKVFYERGYDYLCNYEPPTYPEGMDINIISMEALTSAFHAALAPSQRVHPFSYLSRHKEKFKIGNIEMDPDLSTFHWSLDFPEDVEFIRAVYEKLHRPGIPICLSQVLTLLKSDPRISAMNDKLIRPKALHAFWNSPGIIRDMHADIVGLCKMAEEAALHGQYSKAVECYEELTGIAVELKRQSKFMSEGK